MQRRIVMLQKGTVVRTSISSGNKVSVIAYGKPGIDVKTVNSQAWISCERAETREGKGHRCVALASQDKDQPRYRRNESLPI
jgi:hypothetical protein